MKNLLETNNVYIIYKKLCYFTQSSRSKFKVSKHCWVRLHWWNCSLIRRETAVNYEDSHKWSNQFLALSFEWEKRENSPREHHPRPSSNRIGFPVTPTCRTISTRELRSRVYALCDVIVLRILIQIVHTSFVDGSRAILTMCVSQLLCTLVRVLKTGSSWQVSYLFRVVPRPILDLSCSLGSS